MTITIEAPHSAGQSGSRPLAIEAIGLTKTFHTSAQPVQALAGVNLAVERGTIYALLGPNGAGKTTTINILTTLILPDGGQARVAGFDLATDAAEVRRLIGVTFQETVVDKSLSGREILDVHGRLYHLPKAQLKAAIAELVALVELEEAIDRPVKTYSGGMKRRLELARGLLTRPQVLFLDEPTLGLDPQNRDRIWDYVRRLRAEQGLTILLTTHYMDEAESLADRVGIIDAGRIVAEGSPSALIGALGADVITATGAGHTAEFMAVLRQQDFVAWANEYLEEGQPSGVQIGLKAQAGRSLKPIVELADHAGYDLADLSIKRPSLNDVFLKYTGRRLRD